jgi:hypothetical protein
VNANTGSFGQLLVSSTSQFSSSLYLSGSDNRLYGTASWAENAYWTASGGEIHRIGNVGIGTTNPSTVLDVQGGYILTENAQGYRIDNSSGTPLWAATADANNNFILGSGTWKSIQFNGGGGANTMFVTESYVGIGTTQPDVKLTVAGDAHVTGTMTVDGNMTVDGILYASEFQTTYVSSSIIYSSGSTKFGDSADDIHEFTGSIRQSGSEYNYFRSNVGIGTTNPSEILQVSDGTALGFTACNFATAVFNRTTGASIQVGSTNSGTVSTGFILSSGVKHWVLNHSGPTANNLFSIGHYENAGSWDFDDAPKNQFCITTGSYVGIGTTNPTTKLEVNGGITSSGATFTEPVRIEQTGDTDVTYLTLAGVRNSGSTEVGIQFRDRTIVDPGGGEAGRIYSKRQLTTDEFNLVFDTAVNNTNVARMWLMNDGKLGIGTEGPVEQLHVWNNVSASAYYGDGSNLSGITGSTSASFASFATSASWAENAYWTASGGDIHRIGSVGIGTATPQQELHVVGTGSFDMVGIGISGSDIDAKLHVYSTQTESRVFLVEGQNGALFQVLDELSGSLFAVSDISGLPILEVFDDDRVVMGKFNTNALVVTGSQVGIGTSAPATGGLHVWTDVSASSFYGDGSNLTGIATGSVTSASFADYAMSGSHTLYADNADSASSALSASSADFAASASWAENAYWTASGGEIHRIGSVGIGTNNPANDLTVHSDTTNAMVGIDSADDAQTQIRMYKTGSLNWAILSPSTAGYRTDLNFYAGGADQTRVTFKRDGSVGIGTTTPATGGLHVWTDVSASSFYGDGSNLIGLMCQLHRFMVTVLI